MIGLIARMDITPSKQEAYITYKSIVDIIKKYHKKMIVIIPDKLDNIKDIIDMCDGIILSGGSNISKYDYEIIKYIYDKDIPLLGICLGMQEMSLSFNGIEGNTNNHHGNMHDVYINGSSIYSDSVIKVNSRHHNYIVKTDLKVTGRSSDGIIEMVEDIKKRFFVGVEWHPENLYNYDINAKHLFDKFMEKINN